MWMNRAGYKLIGEVGWDKDGEKEKRGIEIEIRKLNGRRVE